MEHLNSDGFRTQVSSIEHRAKISGFRQELLFRKKKMILANHSAIDEQVE